MIAPARARSLLLAGLAASAAAIAHGGAAAVADIRWLVPALAGAVLAVAGLAAAARLAAAFDTAAADAGGIAAPSSPGPAQTRLATTAATLLAAQAAAHLALVTAGVPGHAGPGTLALHVVLAAGAALAVAVCDRTLTAAWRRLEAAVARLLETLTGPIAAGAAAPRAPIAAAVPVGLPPGRAPPHTS